MPDRPKVWDLAARRINEKRENLAELMAAQMPPGPNRVATSSKAERDAYWRRAITPEEEQLLWAQVMQEAEAEGLAPEDAIIRATPRMAITVYPARSALIRDSGRKLSVTKQIAYAKMHERLGPPTTDTEEQGEPNVY
jgi:hypothetical protein